MGLSALPNPIPTLKIHPELLKLYKVPEHLDEQIGAVFVLCLHLGTIDFVSKNGKKINFLQNTIVQH